ncbi:hypothetical protein [Pseudomonas syringae]|uniref:hypothetical protein n=1 Tax=Pseudomonas syringae TaxID=317 RepID=UPI00137367B2|nr:hypothetical protein [Pseudomonas syringae]NAP32629.1 hypothetical protein [Pseudomonas syringae]
MTTQWENAAASLRKDIQDRALAEFLQHHDVAEIADAASDTFKALGKNEQASVIATLTAQTSVLALHGRIFAMLTTTELELFEFYRKAGRKYGVVVDLVSDADPAELAKAKSQAHKDEIMRISNSTVSVVRQTSE